MEITDGKKVPVVFDSVGKSTLDASLSCLQVRGTLVSNGTTSGPVEIDSRTLAAKGSLWVTRPAMVHYATPRSHMLDMAREVFDMVLAGKITSEPKQSFALADAAEAHRALESRKTSGATVLVPYARGLRAGPHRRCARTTERSRGDVFMARSPRSFCMKSETSWTWG